MSSAATRIEHAPRALFHAGLFRLALRRSASLGVLAWGAAIVSLALASRAPVEVTELAAEGGALDGATVARGLARQSALAALTLVWLPVLGLRAAATVSRWRRGEITWLASRATGARAILFSTWAGALTSGVLQAGLALLAIEAALGGGGPSLRFAGEVPMPPIESGAWLAGTRALAWTIADPGRPDRPGARVRVEVGHGFGAGATAEVSLSARRVAGGERTVSSARIATRGTVEVEVPSGSGAVELTLAASAPEARFFLREHATTLWTPVPDERAASAAWLGRIACALAAWLALGIGIGAWMSAPTTVALLAALWLPAWSLGVPPSWLPGGDLPQVVATIGQGRVPARLDPRASAAALACVALGLALAGAGLRCARRER